MLSFSLSTTFLAWIIINKLHYSLGFWTKCSYCSHSQSMVWCTPDSWGVPASRQAHRHHIWTINWSLKCYYCWLCQNVSIMTRNDPKLRLSFVIKYPSPFFWGVVDLTPLSKCLYKVRTVHSAIGNQYVTNSSAMARPRRTLGGQRNLRTSQRQWVVEVAAVRLAVEGNPQRLAGQPQHHSLSPPWTAWCLRRWKPLMVAL